MSGGRPPKGPQLVGSLAGSRGAKQRLEAILETITGARSVKSACESLGIGEAAFHKLRGRTLQGALEGLEPRARGRPPSERDPQSDRVRELEREVEELRSELVAAEIREEIALVLPGLGKARRPPQKKRH